MDNNNFSGNNSHNTSINFDQVDNNINASTSKPNKKSSIFKSCFKSVMCLGLSLCIGFGIGFVIPIAKTYANQNKTVIDDMGTSNISGKSNKVVGVVHTVLPSVVSINTTSKSQNIFNLTFENTGTGSGIIFYKTPDKVYISTNYHVIENSTSVDVSVDGSNKLVPAKLVGKDSNYDLAVISIDRKDLEKIGINDVSVVPFGNSDNITIGDSVIAIGNALGEGNTATLGLVSAIQDDVMIGNTKMSVIQTDAAINPGNSGGALVNSKGEVIGINTAKLASVSIEGIGYSISSNVAKPIIEQIMNNTNPASLGVHISDVSKEIANLYNIQQTGVLIVDVVPGGNADRNGLKPYDIIIGFNGKPIFSPEQLLESVKKSHVGDSIDLKILRNGLVSKIKIKLQQSNIDTSF